MIFCTKFVRRLMSFNGTFTVVCIQVSDKNQNISHISNYIITLRRVCHIYFISIDSKFILYFCRIFQTVKRESTYTYLCMRLFTSNAWRAFDKMVARCACAARSSHYPQTHRFRFVIIVTRATIDDTRARVYSFIPRMSRSAT